MLYSEMTQSKRIFTDRIFKPFCETQEQCDLLADILYQKFTVETFAYSDDCVWFEVDGYFEHKVIPHKIHVRDAGRELLKNDWFVSFIRRSNFYVEGNAVEQFEHNLFIHDLSKFSAIEAYGYAFHDFKNPTERSKITFEKAWHHHKVNNPHHPEYWLNPNRQGELEVLEMPPIYIGEMIADWIGAGKTYGSTLEDWLPKNLHLFKFHGNTAINLSYALYQLGINTDIIDGKVICKVKI